jgi:competence protein ComEC
MTRQGIFIIAFLLGAALGVRGWFALSAEAPTLLQFAGTPAVVSGTVADDPDMRATAVRAVIRVSEINSTPAEGTILAVLPRDTELQYGDRITVRGVLEEPQSFETNTGRTFDYPGYLRARGISLIMDHASVRETTEGSAGILRSLYALKHYFERALERVMQEPQASLMEGLLLGEKSGLPQALTQAFVLAGLIHIVVLSGYNIGVVAEWVLRLFALFLPRKVALAGAAAVIVLFALMAGGGMATVRAALMGLLAVLARYLNRPAAALRALAVAVAAMLLYNPLILFDVGFILSVLATFGLITLAPWVERYLSWLPAGGVRSTAATTIAVQLYVLPALLYFTGVLSFVSFPINILVLPGVPLAMLLGFLAGLLALAHPYLALLPALCADMLLRAIIWIAQTAASLPLAAAVVPAFPAWIALLIYVPITALAMWCYLYSSATK